MTTTCRTLAAEAGDPPPDVFEACLDEVEAALDQVSGVGAWTLGEEDLRDRFASALRARARIDELACRLLGDLVDRELPGLDGACSPTAWLTGGHRVSVGEAKRLLRGAAVLQAGPGGVDGVGSTRLDPTRSAWRDGSLSAEQAVLIAGTVSKTSPDLDDASVRGVQVDLAGHAKTLSYRGLQTVCNRALEVLDPDAADALLAERLQAEEERALTETRLRFYRRGPGLIGFAGALPTAQYQMLKAALDAHTSPRHTTSLQAAAGLDPDDDQTGAGRLCHEQRLGRALLELIEHLPTDKLARHGGVNAAILITMSLDQLRDRLGAATLPDATLLSPGQARRLACGAHLIPAVLDTDSQILDLGRTTRLFTPPQRIALEHRDQGCVFPGCDRPAPWCESHHIDPWSTGGSTDITNGALLCSFHHHLIHAGTGWNIQTGPDHIPEIVPPARIDPTRTPRRHERFTHPLRR